MNWRLLSFVSILTLSRAFSQGTVADYDRAKAMQGDLMRHVTRAAIQEQWKDGKLYYKVKTGDGQSENVRVDPSTGKREVIKQEEMPAVEPRPRGEGRGRGRGPRNGGGPPPNTSP
ncbi:MAG TPA: hypothetical protein VHM91_02735, partial [Verrucomicrobiales bacterium]|nr:hypothetical protein [Verrucomicrobiales bacterium]